MNDVDERIERLIVRQLDGELTPAEQEELNQVLLRSAEARRMLSEYGENDQRAGGLIGAVAEGRWPAEASPMPEARPRRVRFWGTMVTGLAAAAVIAFVVTSPRQTDAPGTGTEFPPIPSAAPVAPPNVGAGDLVYTSGDVPHRGERWVDRDYIGVFDESRNTLYMIEVDRTRTVRVPVTGDL